MSYPGKWNIGTWDGLGCAYRFQRIDRRSNLDPLLLSCSSSFYVRRYFPSDESLIAKLTKVPDKARKWA